MSSEPADKGLGHRGCGYCAGLGLRDHMSHQTEACPFQHQIVDALDQPVPVDMALLAGKANQIRRRLDASLRQNWRMMLEAEARWLGPIRAPIQTFAPVVGWTRALNVPHGRRDRYRRILLRTAIRVACYLVVAVACILIGLVVR